MYSCDSTRNPCASAAVASKWIVGIDALLFVFILAPLTPPALSRPAGRKRELTAIFGRVYKQRKYTCRGTLKTKMDFGIGNLNSVPPTVMRKASSAGTGGTLMSTCIPSEYFLALNTRPNRAVSSLSRPAGRERVGVRVGPKTKRIQTYQSLKHFPETKL